MKKKIIIGIIILILSFSYFELQAISHYNYDMNYCGTPDMSPEAIATVRDIIQGSWNYPEVWIENFITHPINYSIFNTFIYGYVLLLIYFFRKNKTTQIIAYILIGITLLVLIYIGIIYYCLLHLTF